MRWLSSGSARFVREIMKEEEVPVDGGGEQTEGGGGVHVLKGLEMQMNLLRDMVLPAGMINIIAIITIEY